MSADSVDWSRRLVFGLFHCLLSFGSANAAEAVSPSIEFLEFLGQWETATGDWIDPLALKELDEAEQVKVKVVDEEVKHED